MGVKATLNEARDHHAAFSDEPLIPRTAVPVPAAGDRSELAAAAGRATHDVPLESVVAAADTVTGKAAKAAAAPVVATMAKATALTPAVADNAAGACHRKPTAGKAVKATEATADDSKPLEKDDEPVLEDDRTTAAAAVGQRRKSGGAGPAKGRAVSNPPKAAATGPGRAKGRAASSKDAATVAQVAGGDVGKGNAAATAVVGNDDVEMTKAHLEVRSGCWACNHEPVVISFPKRRCAWQATRMPAIARAWRRRLLQLQLLPSP